MATKAQMEAELEDLRRQVGITNVKSQAVEPDDIDGEHGGLNLDIRGELFECRRVDVSYQMMKFAVAQRRAQVSIPKGMPDGPERKRREAQRNEAGLMLMETMLSTVMILLKPHERDRFDTYMNDLSMSDNPLNPGEFQECIGEVIAAAGGQSGKAKEEPSTSSPSSSSSETTNVSYADFSSVKAGVMEKLPANG